jgi:hypothetical protein
MLICSRGVSSGPEASTLADAELRGLRNPEKSFVAFRRTKYAGDHGKTRDSCQISVVGEDDC